MTEPLEPKPISRVRRYRIRAELRTLRRQSQTSGIPLKTLVSRKIGRSERPEDLIPLAVIARLSPDQLDDQIVEDISNKVTSRLAARLAAAQTDPRLLAREVARLVTEKMGAAPALPPGEAAPPPVPPKPERINIDDIAGMIDQILKEQK